MRQSGSAVSLDPAVSDTQPGDSSWDQVGVAYKDGKLPILVELNRDTGDAESLFDEEIEEFLEFLRDTPDSKNRRRVEEHLRATAFVIAAQLPTNDIDDDGYNALGDLLNYFVRHHGGMIQADGEGFYENDKVILPLE